MELIKKLNEDLRTSMDRETFGRLVRYAKEETAGLDSDVEKLDVVLGMIEDIAGFEDPDDAFKLAHEVLDAARS